MQVKTGNEQVLASSSAPGEELKAKGLPPPKKDLVPPTVSSIDIKTCPEEFVLRLIRKEGSAWVQDLLRDTPESAVSRKLYFRDVNEAFTPEGLESIRKLADRIMKGESLTIDSSNIKVISALYSAAHRAVPDSELTPETQVKLLKEIVTRSQQLLQRLGKNDELLDLVEAISHRITFYHNTYLKDDPAQKGVKLDEMRFPLKSHAEGGLKLLAYQLSIAERLFNGRSPQGTN